MVETVSYDLLFISHNLTCNFAVKRLQDTVSYSFAHPDVVSVPLCIVRAESTISVRTIV